MSIPEKLRGRRYSVQRYYVDAFMDRSASTLAADCRVLDIGGHKKKKAGDFNIERHVRRVTYVNIDASTEPDFLCDASAIPVDDESYGCVILTEVMEHVADPVAVLREAFRVLAPGGILLGTTPFMYRMHADPFDYGRYTDYWLKERLSEIGFAEVTIGRQGLFHATLANQIKLWSTTASNAFSRLLLRWIAYYLIQTALAAEQRSEYRDHWLYGSTVLGLSISATKRRG